MPLSTTSSINANRDRDIPTDSGTTRGKGRRTSRGNGPVPATTTALRAGADEPKRSAATVRKGSERRIERETTHTGRWLRRANVDRTQHRRGFTCVSDTVALFAKFAL